MTPLHIAAKEHCMGVLEYFVGCINGADINIKEVLQVSSLRIVAVDVRVSLLSPVWERYTL